MAIGDALAKNTTYQTIIDKVRLETGTINDDQLTHTLMLKEISLAVQKWAKLLSKLQHPFYVKTDSTLTITGSANPYSVNLSGENPFIDMIHRVVHVTTGGVRTLVRIVMQQEAEDFLALANTNATSIVGVWEGDSIRLYKGSSFTITTATDTVELKFSRQAIVSGVGGSSYPDIPDSYIPVVISEVLATVKKYKNLDATREYADIDRTYKELLGVQ